MGDGRFQNASLFFAFFDQKVGKNLLKFWNSKSLKSPQYYDEDNGCFLAKLGLMTHAFLLSHQSQAINKVYQIKMMFGRPKKITTKTKKLTNFPVISPLRIVG